MEVNADRKGPKDLMDLAHKANAFKSFAQSKIELNAAHQNGDEDLINAAQKKHDDNFEYLMDLHDNDPEALRATAGYIQDRLNKGKSH